MPGRTSSDINCLLGFTDDACPPPSTCRKDEHPRSNSEILPRGEELHQPGICIQKRALRLFSGRAFRQQFGIEFVQQVIESAFYASQIAPWNICTLRR